MGRITDSGHIQFSERGEGEREMSYCRWSSDDFQCDVYVYESCHGGFDTRIAGNKVIFDGPLPEPVEIKSENMDAFFERKKIVDKMLDRAKREKIGLEYDGETFNDPTASECADRLESLKAMGYNVPQYAIDALREEAKEAAK